jgi:hypothetical protein
MLLNMHSDERLTSFDRFPFSSLLQSSNLRSRRNLPILRPSRRFRRDLALSHDPSIAKEADRVLTMRDGALICDTAPSRPEVAALEVS